MYLRTHGATVDVTDDPERAAYRAELGIDDAVASCHTAEVDGYVIEGHVPAEAIQRLLTERPDVIGLALPGMPSDSRHGRRHRRLGRPTRPPRPRRRLDHRLGLLTGDDLTRSSVVWPAEFAGVAAGGDDQGQAGRDDGCVGERDGDPVERMRECYCRSAVRRGVAARSWRRGRA